MQIQMDLKGLFHEFGKIEVLFAFVYIHYRILDCYLLSLFTCIDDKELFW
jgi:hypothetical protein